VVPCSAVQSTTQESSWAKADITSQKMLLPKLFFFQTTKLTILKEPQGLKRLTPISSNQIFGQIGQIDRRSFGQWTKWTPDSLQFLLRNPFIKNTDFGQTWNMALSEDSESHST
jgi:hypothetical protein